jgi:hypothetical protein
MTMGKRKTPILLRRAPMSGGINALTNYRRSGDMLRVVGDGKHDVTADFYAIILEELMDGKGTSSDYDKPSPTIIMILDRVCQGEPLTVADREELHSFLGRLRTIVVEHNGRLCQAD